MNKIIIAISTLVLFASCNNKKEKTVDYAVIQGVVSNAKSKELTLYESYQSLKKIKIKNDGSFVDTLRLEKGGYTFGSKANITPVYLFPGANLMINFDESTDKKNISVAGNGALESNFLALKSEGRRNFYGEEGEKFYALKEEDYKSKLINYKEDLINKLNSNTEYPKDFVTLEKRDLNFYYIEMLLKHQEMHRYFGKDSTYTVSKEFLKDTENVSYELEQDYKYSHTYQGLVRQHYQNIAKKAELEQGIAYDIAYINALGTNKNDFIRNSLLIDAASGVITYVNDIETYYNSFMKFSTNEEDKKVITNLYNQLQLTAPGKVSPLFVDYENHKGGTTSLEDFKGKYVYIDVWATWCGPCLYEVPYLQEVEKQYHDKNIVFVSISVDANRDYNKWKQMVTDKKMGGVQLYADKSFDSDFAKDYIIKAIPKFILIDPDGKIVKSNAPRPSDKKLINLLEELGV